MTRLWLAVLLVLLAVPARAEDATQVAAALRTSAVYQSPGLDLVDAPTLVSELAATDPRVYVAVLPATAAASAAEARERAVEIGDALGDTGAVVLVITANRHFGSAQGSAAVARGVDSGEALKKEVEALRSFTSSDVTVLVTSFAERVANQVATGVRDDGRPVDTGGGGGSGWLLVGLLVVVVAAGALGVRALRRRPQAVQPGTDPRG
ncbi:MAG TPA: hypothetical protein VL281_04420 [Mycobacteriales bacterium]|jgi:hypothetical protein|nr:hypothetical protein [Mycobacteriales bacterium]